MDSKCLFALSALMLLVACEPQANYFYQTHVTADNTPDIVKAQDILEQDLVACGYEVRDHNRWARMNDPVSTSEGHVVDDNGTPREDTPLPTVYELSDCMEGKGWVRLKHYYTTPY